MVGETQKTLSIQVEASLQSAQHFEAQSGIESRFRVYDSGFRDWFLGLAPRGSGLRGFRAMVVLGCSGFRVELETTTWEVCCDATLNPKPFFRNCVGRSPPLPSSVRLAFCR